MVTNIGVEAEQGVAAALLMKPTVFHEVAAIISEQDFTQETCRLIFQAVRRLTAQRRPIDVITVLDAIRRQGFDVSRAYIVELLDTTPTAANVLEHAKIMRQNTQRRTLSQITLSATEDLQRGRDPLEVLAQLQDSIAQAENTALSQELITAEALAADVLNRATDPQHSAGEWISTGYEELDERLGGGMRKGDVYIVAGRPGMGKTTFALNIVCKADVPTLLISNEMEPEMIGDKLMGMELGVSPHVLSHGLLPQERTGDLAEAACKLGGRTLVENRRNCLYVQEIGRLARSVRNLSLIAIDYFGLLELENAERLSGYEKATRISKQIKHLAKDLRVPILLVCQLNRANEGRVDKRPTMADLRDTGQLEQDASGILLLHRKDYYKPEETVPGEPTPVLMRLAKSRHGRPGDLWMYADLECGRFLGKKTDIVHTPPPEPDYVQGMMELPDDYEIPEQFR